MASRPRQQASSPRDLRIGLLSIVAFWTFYFFINTVRALALQHAHQVDMLGRRVVVAIVSMGLTAVLYLFIRGSSAASMRRSMVTAAILALPAAVAYSAMNWVAFESTAPPGWWSLHPSVGTRPAARAPTRPETLDVGHASAEDELTPVQAIAENAANGYFFFIAWATLFLSLRYAGEVGALERRSADLRAAAQYAELRALRYQVNPHFLFNTLNSLSSLVLTGQRERAERMILNLSTFFRTSLSGDPTEDVLLAEEIALQRLYLDIEAVRFPDRLLIEVVLPETLGNAHVPGLILQPLVENAVKHGVSRSLEPVTVRITARECDGQLMLTVENRSEAACRGHAPADGAGVGLRNVRDRLAARFGDKARCVWRSHASGRFEVELSMPIIRDGH